jgi:hypothetical protein
MNSEILNKNLDNTLHLYNKYEGKLVCIESKVKAPHMLLSICCILSGKWHGSTNSRLLVIFLTYNLHPKIREMASVLLHLINENIASMNFINHDLSSLNNYVSHFHN